MKKLVVFLAIGMLFLTACERVAPNYIGVLMQHYGKNGKTDYQEVLGRVNTMGPGTELFQVPQWEQRADFEDRVLHLKASDNTEFTAKPTYAYKLIKGKAVDVVFNNAQLTKIGGDFMKNIENNILEPAIYDVMKEESRGFKTDTLMSDGGNLRFEKGMENKLRPIFEQHGFELIVFSGQLEFTKEVKNKINQRNEVNTNISVLDQQIMEQKKRNDLEELRTQQALIKSRGITSQLLQQ